jgi:hypothetical protein
MQLQESPAEQLARLGGDTVKGYMLRKDYIVTYG